MTTTAPPTVRRLGRTDVVVAFRPRRAVLQGLADGHARTDDDARRRAMARHPVGSARLAPVVPLRGGSR